MPGTGTVSKYLTPGGPGVRIDQVFIQDIKYRKL